MSSGNDVKEPEKPENSIPTDHLEKDVNKKHGKKMSIFKRLGLRRHSHKPTTDRSSIDMPVPPSSQHDLVGKDPLISETTPVGLSSTTENSSAYHYFQDDQLSRITSQFRHFFTGLNDQDDAKKKIDKSNFLFHSENSNYPPIEEIPGSLESKDYDAFQEKISRTLTETGQTELGPLDSSSNWKAPESWAVYVPYKEDMKAGSSLAASRKSISSKLLASAPAIRISRGYSHFDNAWLISPTTTSTIAEEGIKPSTSSRPLEEPVSYDLLENVKLKETTKMESLSDPSIPWSIRVYKRSEKKSQPLNGQQGPPGDTFAVLSCPLHTTAEELCYALAKKFFNRDVALPKYQLYVQHQGNERLLRSDDKPLLLQINWLRQIGYTEKDDLQRIGGEDHSSFLKFVYSEFPSNYSAPSSLIRGERSGLISETHAYLANQYLYMLPVILFSYGPTLEYLDISSNLMLNLPSDFVQNCTHLKTLILSKNELDIVPTSISLGVNITHLDLSMNLLEEPESLSSISALLNLEYVNLQANLLTDLPKSFSSLFRLKHMNLSSNLFTDFPVHLLGLSSLQILDMSFNFIKTLPKEISQLNNIRELILTCNNLSSLPSSISKLEYLTILDVRGNAITDFISLNGLRSLQRFMGDYNMAVSLPDLELPSIVDLSLAKNSLSQIQLTTVALPFLTNLSLVCTNLTSIPNELFSCCVSLKRLILDCNSLKSLPSSISLVSKTLRTLSLANNRLFELPTSVGELVELKRLDVRGNNLTCLPKEIWHCLKLEKLNCSSNLIARVPMPPESVLKEFMAWEALRPFNSSSTLFPVTTPPFQQSSSQPSSPTNSGYSTPILTDTEKNETQPRKCSLGSLTSNMQSTLNMNNRLGALTGYRDSIILNEPLSDENGSATILSSSLLEPSSTMRINHSQLEGTRVDNKLEEIYNENLGLSASLKEFYIGENRITDDSLDAIQYMMELEILNVSYNNIYEIGGSLRRLKKIREFYFSGNQMTSLPDDMDKYRDLRVLFINNNKMVNLPAELGKIINLTCLDASDNSLKYNITNWPYDWNWNWNTALKYLNLSGNKKLDIKSSLLSVPSVSPTTLASGAISNGRLLVLEKSLPYFTLLTNLKILDVSAVRIAPDSVPESTVDKRVRWIRRADSDPFLSGPFSSSALPTSKVSSATPPPSILGMKGSVTPVNNSYGVADVLSRFDESINIYDFLDFKWQPFLSILSEMSGELMLLYSPQVLLGVFEGSPKTLPWMGQCLCQCFASLYSQELRSTLEKLKGQESDDVAYRSKESLDLILTGSIHRAFLSLNQYLYSFISNSPNSTSGIADFSASGIVAHLVGNKLIVASVGDGMAVLCRDGQPLVVSVKHSPWHRHERSRIHNSGGYINTEGFVHGVAYVSRAFGYFSLAPSVIADPTICLIECIESDEFLIVASSGLWNWLDPQTAVDIARSEADDLPRAAKKLRDVVISYGASESFSVQVIGLRELIKSIISQVTASLSGRRDEPSLMNSAPFVGSDSLSTSQFLTTGNVTPGVPTRKKRSQMAFRDTDIMDSSLARLNSEIAPPTGNVSLVFTDIRSSTMLWETRSADMVSSMKVHNAIIRRLIRNIGGYECKTDGDAFMIAFPSPYKALKFCLMGQQHLLEAEWPQGLLESNEAAPVYLHSTDGFLDDVKLEMKEKGIFPVHGGPSLPIYRGLSVRMGINCGTPITELDPITQRMDYFGHVSNKAARITGLASGGQICISGEVYAAVMEEEMDKRIDLLEPLFFPLGEKKLKGIEQLEFVYAAYPKTLAARFYYDAFSPKSRRPSLPFNIAEVVSITQLKGVYECTRRLERVSEVYATKAFNNRRPSIPTLLDHSVADLDKNTLDKELNDIISEDSNMNESKIFLFLERVISRIESSSSSLFLTKLGENTSVIETLAEAFATKDPTRIYRALCVYSEEILRKSSLSEEN